MTTASEFRDESVVTKASFLCACGHVTKNTGEEVSLRCANCTTLWGRRVKTDNWQTDGHGLIQAERKRQVDKEEWTPEHDDAHIDKELASAAQAYIEAYISPELWNSGDPPPCWQWERKWWKPGPLSYRNLVKAGALICAELDRLIRWSPDVVQVEQFHAYTTPPEQEDGRLVLERLRSVLSSSGLHADDLAAIGKAARTSGVTLEMLERIHQKQSRPSVSAVEVQWGEISTGREGTCRFREREGADYEEEFYEVFSKKEFYIKKIVTGIPVLP